MKMFHPLSKIQVILYYDLWFMTLIIKALACSIEIQW